MMDDRELTDAEWQTELREALISFRRASWAERKRRSREDDRKEPWVI